MRKKIGSGLHNRFDETHILQSDHCQWMFGWWHQDGLAIAGSTMAPNNLTDGFIRFNDRNRIRNHIHHILHNRRRRDVCSNRRNLRNRRIHRSSRVPQVHQRRRFRCFRLSRFSLGRNMWPSSRTAAESVEPTIDVRTKMTSVSSTILPWRIETTKSDETQRDKNMNISRQHHVVSNQEYITIANRDILRGTCRSSWIGVSALA